MMDAADLIQEVESEHPLAVRLAEAVSLAVLIDPPLLRRARRELVPEADPGAEADLWSSPLVQSRSPDGLVLIPEVAQALRERLRKSGRLDEAWKLTRHVHGHLTPALQLEEEIAWLSVSDAPGAAQRIEELLQSVLAALVVGERRGLAHWAARALPRLPAGVRDQIPETTHLLEAGARLRLNGDARPLEQESGDLGWIVPADLPRVPVRVRLLEGAVELDAGATDGTLLHLPRTDPLLVTVIWNEGGQERARQATFREGGKETVPVPGQDVRLRTVLGEVYDLRAAGQPGGRLRDWIIDFTEERARHRPFFGREKEQDEILRQIEGAGRYGRLILVEGQTGEGKTALLAHLIDRLADEGREPLHHFFRRGTRSEDVETAERSLRAQLAERFPKEENAAIHFRLPAFLIHLAELGEAGALDPNGDPLVLVLDAIDEAWSEKPGEALLALVPEQLPLQLVVVASVRTESREGLRLPEPVVEVPLGDAFEALLEYWTHSAGFPVERSNFGIAQVLREWLRSDPSRPSEKPARTSTLQSLWDQLSERFGVRNAEAWFGSLAAARGALPSSCLREILGEEFFRFTPYVPFVVIHRKLPSGDEAYELTEGVLREFIASQVDLAPWHRRIAEVVTAAWRSRNVSTELRDYALRHAPSHWLAAGEAREAVRLVLDATFVTEKCRTFGVAALRRDLIECLSPAAGQDILDLSREEAAFLQREPEALVAFLYMRLQAASWKPEDIRELFQLSAGQLPLQPKPPAEDLRKPVFGRRHRSAVVGCRFLERRDTVPAILSWAEDGTLQLWEPDSGEMIRTFSGHTAKVTGAVLLGPDRLLTSSSGGTLRLWTLGENPTSRILGGHEGKVLGVLGLSDRRAVSWSVDRTIRVWDVDAGREELILRGHEDAVTACVATRDGWTLFSGSADATVRQWDLSSGELMHSWQGHQGTVTALEAGEGFVVSASLDRTLRVWPLWTYPSFEPRTLAGHSLGVLGCMAHQEKLASWSYDQTIIIWEANLGPFSDWRGPEKKVVLRGHSGSVLSCAFFPDGDRLVSASADGTLRIWDLANPEGKPLLHVLDGHAGPVRAVALDTEYISGLRGSVAEQIVSASDDRTLRVWNAETGEEMSVLDGDNETLHCIALQDRRRVVTWSRMGDLKVYHVDSNEPPLWLGSPGMAVGGALVTPDDRMLILWSRGLVQGQARIAVWDLARGQEIGAFGGPESPILTCAITPDGSRLIAGSINGSLSLWDIVDQQSIASIPAHSKPVVDIRVSSDGMWALTASWDGALRILDLRKMTSLEVGVEHRDRVFACAMHWDARAAVSASADRTLYLWNLDEGQGRRLAGHDDQVTCCAFTRDGTRVVSCSLDCTLGIWDVRTGALLHRLRGHQDWVNTFVIDDDRGVVYSCSEDRTVRAWDLESGEQRGVTYGVSPFRSLALTYDGVAAGDEAGTFWALELVKAQLPPEVQRDMREGAGIRPEGAIPKARFDVFLSHNSKDRPAVRELAEALRARGLKVWLDEWELIPGRPWREALEEVIRTVRSCAVLVGRDGLGPWQDAEMRGRLAEFVNRKLPVIPVLLPGAQEPPKLPIFLRRFTWLDFRDGLTIEGLDQLVSGITGERPRRP